MYFFIYLIIDTLIELKNIQYFIFLIINMISYGDLIFSLN
jgi:hypothetical protein